METVPELLARDRRGDRPALVTPGGRERSAHELLTNAYRAGNTLRHLGVREGVEVGIAPEAGLHPVLGSLGAAQLGAVTRFDPEAAAAAEARALLVPAADESAVDPGPATKLAVFGGEPASSSTMHWEKQLWSENPAFPVTGITPETPLLVGGNDRASHGDSLAAAAEVADAYGIGPGTRVVVRAPLSEPGAVVAGLLAPLLREGVTVFPEPPGGTEPDCDVAVAFGDAPESAVVDPASVRALIVG